MQTKCSSDVWKQKEKFRYFTLKHQSSKEVNVFCNQCISAAENLLVSSQTYSNKRVLPAETLRRTPCLVTPSPRTAGSRVLIGSAPLRHRVRTTQSLTARQRSTRSSTGMPSVCGRTQEEEFLVFKKKKSPVQFCRSFLCLVPDEAKSSYQVEGTGYDTYLRDAHRQVRLTLQNV